MQIVIDTVIHAVDSRDWNHLLLFCMFVLLLVYATFVLFVLLYLLQSCKVVTSHVLLIYYEISNVKSQN